MSHDLYCGYRGCQVNNIESQLSMQVTSQSFTSVASRLPLTIVAQIGVMGTISWHILAWQRIKLSRIPSFHLSPPSSSSWAAAYLGIFLPSLIKNAPPQLFIYFILTTTSSLTTTACHRLPSPKMADFLQKNGLPSSFSILLCFLSFISPVVMVSDIRYVLPCIVVAISIQGGQAAG